MPILPDSALKVLVTSGDIVIEPFKEKNLTPNGYDLTIAEVAIPAGETKDGKELRVTKGTITIPPQTRFAVSTLERISGGRNHGAMLWLRTSWARRGVLAAFGFIDAGFEGTLTLAAFNGSKLELEIPLGQTFAQAVFVKLEGSAEQLYAQRSGHYQHQEGVTWDKREQE